MPARCGVCGKRHKPRCEPDEENSCLNCGEEYSGELFEHPDTSNDRLCKECLIGYLEESIEEHQADIVSAHNEIQRLKGLKTK